MLDVDYEDQLSVYDLFQYPIPRDSMRKILRSCRNVVYQGFLRMIWKDFAFRYYVAEALKSSGTYDLKLILGQMEKMTSDEQDFFKFVINHSKKSCSQAAQDLWALYETKEAAGGFFVEFGATNGVDISNTVLLEKEYGWRGILAEPNPVWHKALRENRTSTVETRCVHGATGEHLDFMNTPDPEYGGVARKELHGAAKTSTIGANIIKVETISLNDLLEKHNAPAVIDFMSIDTEGSEYEILAPFDFERRRVLLFSIELGDEEKNKAIDRLMKERGYARRFEAFSGGDAWYKKRD